MQMKRRSKLVVFIVIFISYTAYNILWLIGTTFSFGKNDTSQKLIYLLLTFVADLPVMWWIRKAPVIGCGAFSILSIAGFWLAISSFVFNVFTLVAWYIPKFAMVSTSVWMSRSEREA